ncbi:MAG: hypothetical protein GXY07_00850 [Candidatus Hydrogenedentes bacterium]|nr:hypothetical protein [Candidatus Hydrogenedentota bacterium]
MTYYKEKQGIRLWLHILFAVAILSSLLLLFWVGSGTLEGVLLGVTGLLLLNLFCLCTEIRQDIIYTRLGLLFPMLWRRIPLESVVDVREVHYRPLRDAGGWGYRRGRFDGKPCWYYTMRGDQGILVVTRDNRQHIVGSQTPEALARAINEARRALCP